MLLIEEDQNKSSANLFSGLRSGVWCNETQLSYLLYHSKNTPGDFDNWIAVKWYPFTISLNIHENALSFSEKGNNKKKRGNLSPVDAMQQFWMENPNKYFPLYIIRHPANAINQHKGHVLTSYI